jgi:hypothetical protein
MNLNNNPRLENFEICEGRELAEYIDGFVDYIFKTSGADKNFDLKNHGGLHKNAQQVSEADLFAALA